MKRPRNEMKAELMAQAEKVIDELLDRCEDTPPPPPIQIENTILSLCKRLSKQMASVVIGVEEVVRPVTGLLAPNRQGETRSKDVRGTTPLGTIPATTILRPTIPSPPLPPLPAAAAYYLIVQPGGRRIALPDDGELVLGRFDSCFGLAADVDLTHDDEGRMTVSRRHARISGFHGTHTIEDLGSTNGTRLNGLILKAGEVAFLRPGDLIALGNCQLSYEPMPEWLARLPAGTTCRYFLQVTATGRRFDLPTGVGGVSIGRSDPMVGARPDIDLGAEGEACLGVSRRHARLVWEEGGHFLEDLGSAFGTRVNGAILWLGDRIRLKPGDHIWLGGCVVAYDLVGGEGVDEGVHQESPPGQRLPRVQTAAPAPTAPLTGTASPPTSRLAPPDSIHLPPTVPAETLSPAARSRGRIFTE